ncbi:AGAP012164-PA, partial [Anopheles gambiae str. PEST]
ALTPYQARCGWVDRRLLGRGLSARPAAQSVPSVPGAPVEELSRDVLCGKHDLSTELLARADRRTRLVSAAGNVLLLQPDLPQAGPVRAARTAQGASDLGVVQAEGSENVVHRADRVRAVAHTVHDARVCALQSLPERQSESDWQRLSHPLVRLTLPHVPKRCP